MFKDKPVQYIFEQSSGRLLRFFYSIHEGLCFSILDNDDGWSSPSIILKEATPDFSACMDFTDKIHILCQDTGGTLLYLTFKDDSRLIGPVLISRVCRAVNKHTCICCSGQKLYCFYVVGHLGKKLLSYQTKDLDGGGFSEPKVFDAVSIKSSPYRVLTDTNQSIYIFYNRAEDGRKSIGYKKYSLDAERWSGFCPIVPYGGIGCENEILSAIRDYNNDMHLLWGKTWPQKYELVYAKKYHECTDWEKEQVIAVSPFPFACSSILAIKNRIIAYWIRDNMLFGCLSVDSGKTWSKPVKYGIDESTPIYRVYYLSNSAKENPYIFYRDLPGQFKDGIRLVFLDDETGGREENRERNENGMNKDDTNRILASMAKRITLLEEKVAKIHALQQEMEEIIKIWSQKSQDADDPAVPQQKESSSQSPAFSSVTPQYLKDYFKHKKK